MEFPHLQDTNFPLLDNVNVYSYKNEFDYTRWPVATRVMLTNVLWDSTYNDVVKFESNDARDNWFDAKDDSYDIILRSANSIPPDGGIKLPIPFDVASRYNYLVVDIPVMTSTNNPIEYESVDKGIRRWHFFVNEVSSRAPNTTMFVLSLDVWTQFQNDVNIKYLFLERGHAAVALSDVDEYLSNPIENNDWLLAPDVTPASTSLVATSKLIPFGSGRKYVCIATNIKPSDIANLGSVRTSSDYTFGALSYSDIDARYGYQLQVNGFKFGNGEDWSGLHLPTSMINPNGRIANNVYCYALPATDVYGEGTFFTDVMNTCPQLIANVLGCFVVDGSMLSLGTAVNIAGHSAWLAAGNESTMNIPTLSKNDFGYPEKYQRFAKLYTFPYASLELTDNEGEVVTVRIENTGEIHAHSVTSLAFPFLNTRVFFDGIGGVGSTMYQWVDLNGTETTQNMPNSDWFECCFEHDIPCYALYMDGADAWYLDNFNENVRGAAKRALATYHNTVRGVNTQRANTYDDMDTYVTNTNNTCNTNRANMDITIATNTANTEQTVTDSSSLTSASINKASRLNDAANNFIVVTTREEAERSIAAAQNTGQGAVTGGALSVATGMALAAVAAPAVAAAAAPIAVATGIGLMSTYANAVVANDNAVAASNVSQSVASAQVSCNNANANNSRIYDDVCVIITNTEKRVLNTNNNSALSRHTDNNNANARTNAGNTSATTKSNATHSRNVAVMNAQESLEATRDSLQYGLYDANLKGPRTIGSYSGNPIQDYMRTRGVQMKIRTMSKDDVAQVGDWFARYGYAANRMVDMEEVDLVPMEHFCHWKCRDTWIDDIRSSNNAAVTLMAAMFDRGVTVWNNPDEVGKVSIYDN